MQGRRFTGKRRLAGCLVLLLAMSACGPKSTDNMPTFAEPDTAYVPTTGTGNAFDVYAQVAIAVEQNPADPQKQGQLTEFAQKKLLVTFAPEMKEIAEATKLTCDFKFRTRDPFVPAPFVGGWRALGRLYVWKVEQAVKANDLATAVETVCVATKFGFDLMGGGGVEADLGATIVDGARLAILPAWPRLTPPQLWTLSQRIKRATFGHDAPAELLKRERQNVQVVLQYVLEHSAEGKLTELYRNAGADHEVIDHLKKIQGNAGKRIEFFRGLAAEEAAVFQFVSDLDKHRTQPNPKFDKDRMWRRLSRLLFSGYRPLRDRVETTLARTRLLVISCVLERQLRTAKPLPKNLDGVSTPTRIDPFSGDKFGFSEDGTSYIIYSYGKDGEDNGGASDFTHTAPDLLLEPY